MYRTATCECRFAVPQTATLGGVLMPLSVVVYAVLMAYTTYVADIFDYLAWRGDLDFYRAPLNPVDYVIFSQLSYLPFEDIIPSPEDKKTINLHLALKILSEKYKSTDNVLNPALSFKEDPELIGAILCSNRYKDCQLFGFENQIDAKKEFQFSAICIYTGDNHCSIIFRGTDSSFVGWKEDFSMSFKEIVPSQTEAVNYLNKMGPLTKGKLRIGGHSKGGNLAIFASSFCEKKIQKRIREIYSYDAPGFNRNIITNERFLKIKDRIFSYVPQGSIIGMMLEHGCEYNIIKSCEVGLMQHSLYSWEISHNDMIHVDKADLRSRFFVKTLREWLKNTTNEQRELFINAIYTIMTESKVKSTHEIERALFSSVGKIIKALGNTEEATKKLIKKTFAELFVSAGKNLEMFWKPHNNG